MKNLAKAAFFFLIRLKWVFQPNSQSSQMSSKRMFKPLSCRGDGEREEEGGRGLSGLLHPLVTQPFCRAQLFSGASPLPSPDGAACATAAEATATTALRSTRPQLSEPRVIGAD